MKHLFVWAIIFSFFLWILSDLNDTEIVRKGTVSILMFICCAMARIEILFEQLKRRGE